MDFADSYTPFKTSNLRVFKRDKKEERMATKEKEKEMEKSSLPDLESVQYGAQFDIYVKLLARSTFVLFDRYYILLIRERSEYRWFSIKLVKFYLQIGYS